MRGKNKCKILKEIRQKIADENDIPYVTQECTHHSECKGTCPKCEAELRYLEDQLAKRQRLGKTVTVAALAASLMANLTACPSAEKVDHMSSQKENTNFFSDTTEPIMGVDEEWADESLPETLDSAVSTEEDTAEFPDLIGEVEATEETEDLSELEGDIVFMPDETESEEIDPGMIAGMIEIDESTCELPTDGDE